MVNTSYLVVFQYKKDVLKFFQHAEGYVSATYGFRDYFYNYKYNGKELQDELGLNMYDYGARLYDPARAGWSNSGEDEKI